MVVLELFLCVWLGEDSGAERITLTIPSTKACALVCAYVRCMSKHGLRACLQGCYMLNPTRGKTQSNSQARGRFV